MTPSTRTTPRLDAAASGGEAQTTTMERRDNDGRRWRVTQEDAAERGVSSEDRGIYDRRRVSDNQHGGEGVE